jgi:4'-phosphopantetheinyl transferase
MLILYAKISEENHSFLLDKYLNRLEPVYRDKLLKFRRWQDIQLSLLGRLLLQEGLSLLSNEKINLPVLKYSEYGKPYFLNGFHFNISHSKDIVICALNKKFEIGIDIEIIKVINPHDFKNQMTDYEWFSVANSGNSVLNFYKYWTEKEAVLKAEGKGLSTPLKSFEIIDNKTILNAHCFFTSEIKIADGYCCSLAIKADSVDFKTIKIQEVVYDSRSLL